MDWSSLFLNSKNQNDLVKKLKEILGNNTPNSEISEAVDNADISIFAQYSNEMEEYVSDEFTASHQTDSYEINRTDKSLENNFVISVDDAEKLQDKNTSEISTETATDESPNEEQKVKDLLESMYNDEKVVKALDADNDGILSDEEKSMFESYIVGYKNNGNTLTEADVQAAYDDIRKGEFNYGNTEATDPTDPTDATDPTDPTDATDSTAATDPTDPSEPDTNVPADTAQADSAGSPSGSSRAGGGSYSGGVDGGSGLTPGSSLGSDSTDTAATSGDISGKSVEELESMKSTKQSEIGDARQELNDVYSGNNEEVKKAMEDEDQAKEDYLEAVKNDEQISDELKTDLEKTLNDISSKEDEINSLKVDLNDAEAKVTDQEALISDDEANISAIESTLSSLRGQTSDDPEVQAQIDANISELEAKKTEAEAKRDADQAVLDDELIPARDDIKNTKIPEAEGQLKDLVTHKDEIQKEIEETCSEETKEAIQKASEAYDTAREEVPKIQEEQKAAAQSKIDGLQTELDKINEELKTKKAEEVKNKYSVSDYEFDFDYKFVGNQENDLKKFKELFEENKDKYQKVADATGVPAELIAAIHWRESSGNFSTYLHNGDPLGKPTTHVPAGLYFEDWTEAAIDAINKEKEQFITYRKKQGLPYNSTNFSENFKDIKCWYDYAEAYNGLGNYNHGRLSSYVWAGSDKYTSGKYVADHKYDPNTVDKQLGVAIMLKYLLS